MKEFEFTVKVVSMQGFDQEQCRLYLEDVLSKGSTRASYAQVVDEGTECKVPAEEN